MTRWQTRPERFKFQLSDLTLFSISIPLQVRHADSLNDRQTTDLRELVSDPIAVGSQGFLIRGVPVAQELPTVSQVEQFICYVPLQYQHSYIDLNQSFADYQKRFSSKTRSTLNRKVRKFIEHCNGIMRWETYKHETEMKDFFHHARQVSAVSYQERLLDAGIPGSDDFIKQSESLAAKGEVRAYVLFDGERPVSYLYCPVHKGALIYAYLGYDPAYLHLSVGSVLQWLALQQIFEEARFRYFDFTEGQSEHKRLFATHQLQCANIFLLKASHKNHILIRLHSRMNQLSKWAGETLDRLGLKAKLKRVMRFRTWRGAHAD